MKIENSFTLTGTPKIWLHYNDGTKVLHFEERNLITLSAKQVLLSGLYLPGVVSDPITKLWVGTGGTIDPLGQFPKPLPVNPSNLFEPLLSVDTGYTVDNAMPSVTYIADIDSGSAVGKLITEAGLFKASGLMFNIKTFPGIPKTSEFSIHFEWTIEMT